MKDFMQTKFKGLVTPASGPVAASMSPGPSGLGEAPAGEAALWLGHGTITAPV
jgi:hypothetical protein